MYTRGTELYKLERRRSKYLTIRHKSHMLKKSGNKSPYAYLSTVIAKRVIHFDLSKNESIANYFMQKYNFLIILDFLIFG